MTRRSGNNGGPALAGAELPSVQRQFTRGMPCPARRWMVAAAAGHTGPGDDGRSAVPTGTNGPG
jgi:hypothetical protein